MPQNQTETLLTHQFISGISKQRAFRHDLKSKSDENEVKELRECDKELFYTYLSANL